MTSQKAFKQRIRARMDKTGESYTTARRQLVEKSETEARKRRSPRTISGARFSDESVREHTGRAWSEWFEVLDAWGASTKPHPEIASWITTEHRVDGWWAQAVTVAYEQERGIRVPGQRADGTFGVSASKTVAVPVETLFEAFRDEGMRRRWLGEVELDVRTARPGKSMTAVWDDSATRLSIGFTAKGPDKSQVALEHAKIVDPRQADELKAFWRERLSRLKELLEG